MQKLLELAVDTTTVYLKGKERYSCGPHKISGGSSLHFWNAPMLSDLDEDSSSKNWCARPSRVQNRLKVLREISGVPSSRECRFRAKEPSLTNGGYAFFDEIPLNFPKPQRRKHETVCWFKLGSFVLVPHSTRRCLGTLARFLRCPFGLRRSQTCPP